MGRGEAYLGSAPIPSAGRRWRRTAGRGAPIRRGEGAERARFHRRPIHARHAALLHELNGGAHRPRVLCLASRSSMAQWTRPGVAVGARRQGTAGGRKGPSCGGGRRRAVWKSGRIEEGRPSVGWGAAHAKEQLRERKMENEWMRMAEWTRIGTGGVCGDGRYARGDLPRSHAVATLLSAVGPCPAHEGCSMIRTHLN